MKVETEDLIKVGTVVQEKGVTARYVYSLIEKGIFEGVRIDGMQFIFKNSKYKNWTKAK